MAEAGHWYLFGIYCLIAGVVVGRTCTPRKLLNREGRIRVAGVRLAAVQHALQRREMQVRAIHTADLGSLIELGEGRLHHRQRDVVQGFSGRHCQHLRLGGALEVIEPLERVRH